MICENLRQSAEKNLKGRLVGYNEVPTLGYLIVPPWGILPILPKSTIKFARTYCLFCTDVLRGFAFL